MLLLYIEDHIDGGYDTAAATIKSELGSLVYPTRAVGTACKRNPIPIIVPCHRVLGSGGTEGGYSGGQGLPTKHKLLALEGVVLL